MLRITKDTILHVMEIDGHKDVFDIFKTENGMVSYLDQLIELDENVTLADILTMLGETSMDDIDYVFDASLGGNPFEDYINELDDEVPLEDTLFYLEVVHDVRFLDDGMLSEDNLLRAIGKDPEGKESPFSVELIPVCAYKNLLIKLNKAYRITRSTKAMNEEGEEVSIDSVEIDAKKNFTLYEFIHAILYEISFHGTPKERQEVLEEILSLCQEAYDKLGEDAPIFTKTIGAGAAEEIKRLQEDLEQSVEAEDYETSVKLRDRIALLTKDMNRRDAEQS